MELIEPSALEWIFVFILLSIFIILVIFGTVFFLYVYLSNKIHSNYHEGYNKAKDDKVQYYKTIKEITDSFNEIFSELTKEGSSNMYKAHTLELMINFKKSLQDYYNN